MKNSQVKKLLLVLILAVAFTTGVFHYIGIVDLVDLSYRIGEKIPVLNKYMEPKIVTSLDIQKDELYFLQQELIKKEMEINEQKEVITRQLAQIEETRKQLQYTEATLVRRQREMENKARQTRTEAARVAKLVEFYQNMPPASAAAILAARDEQTGEEKVSDEIIIAILESMDAVSASYILSRMNAQRVSVITRKMLTALN